MRFHVRPIRVLSALLLVAVTNVYVFAGVSASSNVPFGKLVTMSNRPIVVNGAEAITGTNIFSGAQLMTPAGNLATVQLDKLATVTIGPASVITLNFDSKNVVAHVLSGNATISAEPGVTASVLDKSGAPVVPGTAIPPAGGNTAKNWGIAGVGIGSAALIWAIISWNKANNAEDDAKAAQASAASLASQLAALRTCLAGQTTSPVKLCTSF